MPVYYEARTPLEIVAPVLAARRDKEVIVVGGCPTDATRSILAELAVRPEVVVLLHERNRGWARLRSGFAAAIVDVVIV